MTGQITADAVPPDRAFATFTDGIGTWWPREYTWAGDVLDVHPRPLRCSGGLSPTGEMSSFVQRTVLTKLDLVE